MVQTMTNKVVTILVHNVEGMSNKVGSDEELSTQGEKVSIVKSRTRPTMKYHCFFSFFFIITNFGLSFLRQY